MSLRPFLIRCLLLLLVFPAMAEESGDNELDWYEVEVIVFAHARGEYFDSETWPRQPGTPDLEAAIDFDQTEDRDNRYRDLGTPSGPLEQDLKRIERSSRYQVLARRHWRQPGLPMDEASPVRIRSEETLRPEPETGNTLPRFFADEEPAPVADGPLPVLDGTVTIERSRFLHIHADLVYRAWVNYDKAFSKASGEQSIEAGSENIGPRLQNEEENGYIQHFELQQQRKTRSGETQFLDHPMFGVIVHITPVEAKAR